MKMINAVLATLALLLLAGCPKPKEYVDQTPEIGRKADTAATQNAAIGDAVTQARSEQKAGVSLVQTAKAKAKQPEVLGPLTDSLAHFSAADAKLLVADGIITAQAGVIHEMQGCLTDQAKANANLKTDYDKLQGRWNDVQDDWVGPAAKRFMAHIGIGVIVLISLCIVAVGVVGVLYGVPKITSPAAGIIGGIVNWIRLASYYVGTFVLSAIPVIGHWIDEHLWTHRQLQQTNAAANVWANMNAVVLDPGMTYASREVSPTVSPAAVPPAPATPAAVPQTTPAGGV